MMNEGFGYIGCMKSGLDKELKIQYAHVPIVKPISQYPNGSSTFLELVNVPMVQTVHLLCQSTVRSHVSKADRSPLQVD